MADTKTYYPGSEFVKPAIDLLGINKSGAGPYGKLGDGQSQENVSYIDALYHEIYGQGMPGGTFDRVKSDRTFADNLKAQLETIYTSGGDKSNLLSDTNNRRKYVNLGLITQDEINAYDIKKEKEEAEKNKPPEYKFTMPTEWQTIEDAANATVAGGMPTLDPSLVNSWNTKLEESYAPVREKLKTNMADYWASLFPQGGGTSKQAVKNMGQLTDFETNKLNTALGLAQTDLGYKVNDYNNALEKLSGIGQFKAASDQFKSSADASNYWQQMANNWTQNKYIMDAATATDNYNKQAELAKYLAQVSQPQSMDFGQQLLAGLTGGASQAAGAAGMAKILAMLA